MEGATLGSCSWSGKLFAANLKDLDAHLVAHEDRRFSAAMEIFQRDLLSGLTDQARTKVSTE